MTFVVVQAFGPYAVGSKISDPAIVATILAGPNARCVVAQGTENPQSGLAAASAQPQQAIPSKLIVVAPLSTFAVGAVITDLGQIASIIAGPYRSAVVAPSDAVLIAAPGGSAALGGLAIANTTAVAGSGFSSIIYGLTSGSSIAATASDGTAVAVTNGTLAGTFATAGTPTITLTETLSGATNSPRTTVVSLTVSAAAPLGGVVDFTKAINSGLIAALAA